jgi:hypothetical protein
MMNALHSGATLHGDVGNGSVGSFARHDNMFLRRGAGGRRRPGPGADRRRRRRRRLALCRILHRQHPQPQHAARLCARVQPVLCLVRRPRSDIELSPPISRSVRRPFGARREAAARGGADDVRLADRRPGDAVQSGLSGRSSRSPLGFAGLFMLASMPTEHPPEYARDFQAQTRCRGISRSHRHIRPVRFTEDGRASVAG